jgi:hypothetical protein
MKYKVKWGFGTDDFTIIDETEVSKAMRAQINGTIVVCGGESIAGRNIINIKPYINSIMGWSRTYQPTSEDYADLGGDDLKALRDGELFLENTTLQITGKQLEIKNKELPPSQYSKELSEKFKV